MVVADLTGLASALFIPLIGKTVARTLYERRARQASFWANPNPKSNPSPALALRLNLTRSARAEEKKKAKEKAGAESQPASLEQPGRAGAGTSSSPGLHRQSTMPVLQRQGTTPVLHHQGIMVAMKAATKTQDGVIPFIEGALVEHATRYEVARHIVRRTYSAYERLPLGAIVLHPDRGRGTIVEVLPDLRRVVRFDKGGEAHRYSPHSLYKLVQNPHRKPTAQLPCVSSCQTSTADATSKNTETAAEDLTHGGAGASRVPSKEPSWNTLSMIRAGEIAALQHLECNEKSKADELNALRSLPSQALRQRSVVRQRSWADPRLGSCASLRYKHAWWLWAAWHSHRERPSL